MMVKKGKISNEELRKELNKIYTPLSEAKKEIWQRWNDKALRKEVDEFFGGDIPEVFKDGPKAFLFRFVATPNHEYKIFLDLVNIIGMDPVYIEFFDDKFCTRNSDKVYLGKMGFFHGYDKKGDELVRYKKIFDIEKCDNKSFREIETFWGEKLIDFHGRLFDLYNKECDNKKVKKVDISVLGENGNGPLSVYKKLFPLFLCHGIFFENYFIDGNKYEIKFFTDVIKPAFDATKRRFGIKPLIVPLIGTLSKEEEEDLFWQHYPKHLINELK